MTQREVARPDDLRRRNRRSILDALRRGGALSRTEISARTGLSPATVSIIASALIAEGVLEESPGASGGRGRPQVAMRLNPQAVFAAAASLTQDQVLLRLADYAGREVAATVRRLDMGAAPPGALIEAVASGLRELLGLAGPGRRLGRLSLGVRGVADARGEAMIWSPVTPEREVAFAQTLGAEFGAPVFVANDCAAIVQALRFADPEHYGEDFAALLLSQGVGLGLHLRGTPFLGRLSSAMEFGHLTHRPGGALCRCGSLGCIEAYAGGYALTRRARGEDEQAPPEAGEDRAVLARLIEKARAGPGPEREAFLEAGRAIGYGLRNFFVMLDPLPMALVGPGAAAFDLMEPEIRAALAGIRGLRAADVKFRLYADEFSLILEGGILGSLLHLDEAFAAGDERVEGCMEKRCCAARRQGDPS